MPSLRPLLKDCCSDSPQEREKERVKKRREGEEGERAPPPPPPGGEKPAREELGGRNTVAGTEVGLNHIKAHPGISWPVRPDYGRSSLYARNSTYKVTRPPHLGDTRRKDEIYESWLSRTEGINATLGRHRETGRNGCFACTTFCQALVKLLL